MKASPRIVISLGTLAAMLSVAGGAQAQATRRSTTSLQEARAGLQKSLRECRQMQGLFETGDYFVYPVAYVDPSLLEASRKDMFNHRYYKAILKKDLINDLTFEALIADDPVGEITRAVEQLRDLQAATDLLGRTFAKRCDSLQGKVDRNWQALNALEWEKAQEKLVAAAAGDAGASDQTAGGGLGDHFDDSRFPYPLKGTYPTKVRIEVVNLTRGWRSWCQSEKPQAQAACLQQVLEAQGSDPIQVLVHSWDRSEVLGDERLNAN